MNLPKIAYKPLFKKIVLWGAGLFILIGVLGFLVAPHFVKPALEKSIGEKLHRTATIRKLGINPYALSATINGFVLSERNGSGEAFSFDELYVNVEAVSLLRLAPVIGRIGLVGPHLSVVRNADLSYNYTDVIEELLNQPDTGQKSWFSISRIQVSGGHVGFEDKPKNKHHTVSDIELNVPFVSNLPSKVDIDMVPSFSAKVNGTPLALTGQMKLFKETPVASIDLNINDLDLPKYFDYTPIPLNFRLPSGLLDSKLVVNFSRPQDRPIALTVAGTLGLKKIELVDIAGQPLLKWKTLSLGLHSFDIMNRRLALDSVLLDQPELFVRRDKGGELNLIVLQPVAAPKKNQAKPDVSAADEKAAATAAPFEFSAAEIKLVNGMADIADTVPKKPFHVRINAINLTVLKLASSGKEPASVDLMLQTESGESARQHAQVTLSPLSAQGELTLSAFKLKNYASYYAPFIRFNVEEGAIEASMKYSVAMTDDELQFSISDAAFNLAALKLRQQNDNKPFFTLAQLAVKGAAFDLSKRDIVIGELTTRGGKLLARRDREGVFNLAQLLALDSGKSSVAASGESAHWSAVLNKLALNDYGVRVEDEKVADSLPFSANAISLNADNLSTARGAKARVALKASFGKRGRLDVNGTLAVLPLQARLKLNLRSVDLVPLQAYFTERFNVTLTRGAMSTGGMLLFGATASEKLNTSYRGDANIEDFALIDKPNSADLLKWQSLAFSGIDFNLNPLNIVIGDVAISDFYSRLILSAEGKLNLVQLMSEPGKEESHAAPPNAGAAQDIPVPENAASAVANSAAAAAEPLPYSVRIGRVVLQGGNVNYSDYFIKPNYTANMMNIGGSVTGLSSESGSTANVDLRGELNSAPVLIAGKVNPLAREIFLDLKAGVQGFELGPLSPYSGKYAGYAIQKGKLTLDLHYFIENRKLQAENKLFLDQLTFGEKVESPDATKLPVQLALALLKNRRGEIDINLPISGSLDDPKFSVGGIIARIFVNLIVKAVTSPFALLGSLFGGGADLAYVEFNPGYSVITPAAETRLKALANALLDRPALKLDIIGRVDPGSDNEGIRLAQMEHKIKAQKLKAIVKQGEDAGSVEDVKLAPEEYQKFLKLAYKEESFPKPRNMIGLAKDLPPQEMEKLMLTNARVTDEDMRALANQRAQAAKDWLIHTGQVPPERVFIIAPKLDAGDIKDKGKASRADFSLK